MGLSAQDWIALGQLGAQVGSGITQGIASKNNKKQNELDQLKADELRAQDRDDQFLQMILQALMSQGNTEQDISQENFNRSVAFSNANPLGAEQNFRAKNNVFRGGLEALGNRSLARGTPNLAAGFLDRAGVADSLSDSAVDEAIRQRRIATTGLNPSASMEIGGTNGYAERLFGDVQNSQNAQRNNNQQILDMINQQRGKFQQPTENTAQPVASTKSNEPGFWRKFGSVALPVAGAAANFIPGVGPKMGTALSTIGGAAGGALANGKQGALTGAVSGATTGALINAGEFGKKKTPLSDPGQTQKDQGIQMMLGNQALDTNVGPQPTLASRSNNKIMPYPSATTERPSIQKALTVPQVQGNVRMQSANGVSGNKFNFGNKLDIVPQNNGFNSNMSMFGNDIDLAKLLQGINSSENSSQTPVATQRLPIATSSTFPDFGRFSDAKVGGYGAPINTTASKNFGDVAGPGMNTVVPGALVGTLGAVGAFGTGPLVGAAGTAMASPTGQRMLNGVNGITQRQLPAARIAGYLPKQTSTNVEAQQVVAKLLDALKAYNTGSPADVRASQDLLRFMQPYLRSIQ